MYSRSNNMVSQRWLRTSPHWTTKLTCKGGGIQCENETHLQQNSTKRFQRHRSKTRSRMGQVTSRTISKRKTFITRHKSSFYTQLKTGSYLNPLRLNSPNIWPRTIQIASSV